ncbi:hypothetical protein F5B20DRAFT_563159 [Whalleya microplaca]|nr:hypothetical protein F5B20DRAFT_563159 [Whalleya microplaca]
MLLGLLARLSLGQLSRSAHVAKIEGALALIFMYNQLLAARDSRPQPYVNNQIRPVSSLIESLEISRIMFSKQRTAIGNALPRIFRYVYISQISTPTVTTILKGIHYMKY